MIQFARQLVGMPGTSRQRNGKRDRRRPKQKIDELGCRKIDPVIGPPRNDIQATMIMAISIGLTKVEPRQTRCSALPAA